MQFRAWKADVVLEELERLHSRYGIGRFYAMDLILPREYVQTLFPEIARREHKWMFFWEIKSNMKRHELEVLAAAGVRWIQPGIESLDSQLLRLMKKGVSPLQNILLLKWCEELSIFCGWNLLFGLPGESQTSYDHLTAIIPKLFHLRPPSGGGEFQLHRFSPYFDHPADHGMRWLGAHRMFKFAFPIPKQDLDELVYLHEFVLDDAKANSSETLAAVKEWRRAYQRGASLTIHLHSDGSSRIEDTRHSVSDSRTYDLSIVETALYLFLDGGIKQTAVEQSFLQAYPELIEMTSNAGSVSAIVERWILADLVLAIDGQVVALALNSERAKMNPPTNLSQLTIDNVLRGEPFSMAQTV
jgi:ribosomal peptide maturation radical SAM protein 1